MDDLYVVQQLSNKVSEEAMEIGDLWAKYSATKEVVKAPKAELEKDVSVPKEIPSLDSINFEIQDGVDIVVINEEKGNFTPLFLFTTEKMHFNQDAGKDHQDMSDG